jgi:hypothetical protein
MHAGMLMPRANAALRTLLHCRHPSQSQAWLMGGDRSSDVTVKLLQVGGQRQRRPHPAAC